MSTVVSQKQHNLKEKKLQKSYFFISNSSIIPKMSYGDKVTKVTFSTVKSQKPFIQHYAIIILFFESHNVKIMSDATTVLVVVCIRSLCLQYKYECTSLNKI